MSGFFQRLFGRPKDLNSGLSVRKPASEGVSDLEEHGDPPLSPPQLIVGCAQSAGLQRDHNEDALFTLTTTLASDHSYTPFGLYIVADGMGGHQHGEIASGIAVRAMASYIIRKLYTPLFSLKPTSPAESIQEMMRAGVQEAHRAIIKEAPGGGTTLTAVLVFGEQLTIAHVGDSRAYKITSDGKLQVLTRDHSLVRRLEELGQITSEEAAIHPQRNVLYRALGQGEPVDPDVSTSPIPHNGSLLLCSDGLWGVVPEHELSTLIEEGPTPQRACQRMVEAANKGGGPDNITAILVHMPG